MRVWIVIVLMGFIGTVAYGQENTAEQTPQKQLTPAQILMLHAAKKYQLALRYNDPEAAKQALYSILAENPANDSLLYTLSFMYLERRAYASAAITSKDLITINPDHTGGLEILGIAYENLGLSEKALDAYEDLYFKTSDYQTLYKVAFMQFQTGKYNESMTNADILLSKKEADEIMAMFPSEDETQKEYPIRVALLNLKGMNAKEQNKPDEARKYFNEALAISPDFKIAKDGLSELK